MVIIFVFPDGSIGVASSRREAIRRFKSFEKGEEIDFDDFNSKPALSLSASVSASVSASASDSGFNSDSDS